MPRRSRSSLAVASGCALTSSARRSMSIFLTRAPPAGRAETSPVCRLRCLRARTHAGLTSKVSATSLVGIPRSHALSTRSLKSCEYAIPSSCPARSPRRRRSYLTLPTCATERAPYRRWTWIESALDTDQVRGHLDEVVRSTTEETLNAMLDAEADRVAGVAKYDRAPDRRDTRAGSYPRKLQTKTGEVTLKVPRLRKLPLEIAIIERYKQRESSVAETPDRDASGRREHAPGRGYHRGALEHACERHRRERDGSKGVTGDWKVNTPMSISTGSGSSGVGAGK